MDPQFCRTNTSCHIFFSVSSFRRTVIFYIIKSFVFVLKGRNLKKIRVRKKILLTVLQKVGDVAKGFIGFESTIVVAWAPTLAGCKIIEYEETALIVPMEVFLSLELWVNNICQY